MTPVHTAATMKRLESGAKAEAFSLSLRAQRLRADARAQGAAASSADADIRRASLWPSFVCATLSGFRDGCVERAAGFDREALSSLADAELARDSQRRWASLRRGFERRAERAAELEAQRARASLAHYVPAIKIAGVH